MIDSKIDVLLSRKRCHWLDYQSLMVFGGIRLAGSSIQFNRVPSNCFYVVVLAGDSSLGKSTLINTLFNSPIFNTDTASSSSMPASSPTKGKLT